MIRDKKETRKLRLTNLRLSTKMSDVSDDYEEEDETIQLGVSFFNSLFKTLQIVNAGDLFRRVLLRKTIALYSFQVL